MDAQLIKLLTNYNSQGALFKNGDVEDKNRTWRPVKRIPNSKERVQKSAKDTGTGLRWVTKILNLIDDYKRRGKSVYSGTVRNFVRKTEWGKGSVERLFINI